MTSQKVYLLCYCQERKEKKKKFYPSWRQDGILILFGRWLVKRFSEFNLFFRFSILFFPRFWRQTSFFFPAFFFSYFILSGYQRTVFYWLFIERFSRGVGLRISIKLSTNSSTSVGSFYIFMFISYSYISVYRLW